MRGRRDEALAEFREAIRIDPAYAQAHNNLGAVLQALGRTAEALDHFRRAVTLRPDNFDARVNLARLLSSEGKAADAIAQFNEAVALKNDDAAALSGLAWLRATAADESLRNATQAMALAERAAALTDRKDLSVLDALAAAYAAAGRFDEAVETVQAAVSLAESKGLTDVAARFRERLSLYQQRRPYRFP